MITTAPLVCRLCGGPAPDCDVCVTCWDAEAEKAHREERAAYRRRYYQAHREERAAYQRRYYQAHREEAAAYQRRYRERKAIRA